MRHSTVFGFRKQLFYEPSRGYACKAVPTLVEDFHPNALMQLHTSRSENRAEGSDYASMVANHLADVFRMDAQFEDNHRLPLNRANLHFFRMVHKCLCDCLQQLLREVKRRMHELLRQCARCSRGKLKERKGGHAEATTLRGDSATNPSGSDNLLTTLNGGVNTFRLSTGAIGTASLNGVGKAKQLPPPNMVDAAVML